MPLKVKKEFTVLVRYSSIAVEFVIKTAIRVFKVNYLIW